ncbi:MAG: hypothetical protein VKP72_00025 [bacterium]|nr:hypothetical protein [bacterium]
MAQVKSATSPTRSSTRALPPNPPSSRSPVAVVQRPTVPAAPPLDSRQAGSGLTPSPALVSSLSLPGKGPAAQPVTQPVAQPVAPSVTQSTATPMDATDRLRAGFAGDSASLAAIERLKDSKALEERDSTGTMLVDRLVSMMQPAKAAVPGMPAGPELVRQLLADLSNPASIHQGVGTTHCTVASLQSILASAQPAEYARVAEQLSVTGTADLQGGDRIEILPGDFTVAEGRNALADAFQESFFRLGSTLGGSKTAATGTDQFGGVGLLAARRTFAGDIPGGLTIDQYTKLHQLVTGVERVLVAPDAAVWNQLIVDRVDEKGREKPLNATAFLAPQAGSSIGHVIVIERLSQQADGSLTAHVRDPLQPGLRAIPLTELQPRVQLIEMTPPRASSSPVYLDRVARASTRTA